MFQDAIISLSTSIATIFPLINVKGPKALVSEIGTDSNISHAIHINGLEFTKKKRKRKFNNEECRCIPKQVRKSFVLLSATSLTKNRCL